MSMIVAQASGGSPSSFVAAASTHGDRTRVDLGRPCLNSKLSSSHPPSPPSPPRGSCVLAHSSSRQGSSYGGNRRKTRLGTVVSGVVKSNLKLRGLSSAVCRWSMLPCRSAPRSSPSSSESCTSWWAWSPSPWTSSSPSSSSSSAIAASSSWCRCRYACRKRFEKDYSYGGGNYRSILGGVGVDKGKRGGGGVSSSSSSSCSSPSPSPSPFSSHAEPPLPRSACSRIVFSLSSSQGRLLLRRKVSGSGSGSRGDGSLILVLSASRGEVFGSSATREEFLRAIKREAGARGGATGSSSSAGWRNPGRLIIEAVFERFTERAIKSIMLAQREAKAQGRGEVGTTQLLLGLIAEERSNNGFLKTGVTIERAREVVREMAHEEGLSTQRLDKPASEISFSHGSKRVFEGALEESRTMGHNYVAPEHIAVSLLKSEDAATSQLLERLGLRKDKMLAEAVARLQGELAKDGRTPLSRTAALAGKPSGGLGSSRATRKERSALNEFCVDITARAAEGKVDPVIGREKEVQRVVEILARRTKNNPILLGEPGVGKTAIAEGLALRIVTGTVPDFLLEKRLLSLDMGLLLAGAKERGELETRVTSLIAEATKSGSVILLIDEVHTLVGSGSVGRGGGGGGGGLDIANLLKPALARGFFQCIGATTLDEHRKHIEKDKALARRFQPVMVHEPTEEDTVAILMGLKDRYEQHHHCMFSTEAVESAVHLSSRYIMDRYLPDKAIDLIDEAGSRARINAFKARKDKQSNILLEAPSDIVVGPEEIAAVASIWSGIPVQQLSADEKEKLLDLENALRTRVVGQDDAVSAISRAVRRARVGLKDPDRPIAVMMFSGPTGVGKTELTKALAHHYFGSEGAMIRLDMSEYMERHTVSKLVGSPPGYVGYGEGGLLTEAVRRRPFTVVLLDEIEKAHPDVFNLLLQIFEDGRLTDSQGRTVSFKNTLIVLTSNVGSTAIAKGGSNTIGFTFEGADEKDGGRYSRLKSLVMDELKGYFRPELLNRLDEVVVFRPLERSQVREIVDMMLNETKGRLAAKGIALEVTEAALVRICNEGYDRAYGARPLRRALVRLVEDPLSEAILAGKYDEGDTALVDINDDGTTVITQYHRPDPCKDKVCLPVVKPIERITAVSD
ncbi:hypothetical protein CBR_g57961 [Chara braunii]|uniref:Clp R domain-containing protein n=1 Tax=Chara braunii TaxID=69332 RepID=A0A388MEM6_CHABU|nr:hypothetical protein CBR_g57961 [Chara braunii]|eukprot:GBG92963.1 hypothetical protein CBR_g57961 [Chara braunii]